MWLLLQNQLTGVEYYLNKLANLLGGLALECKLYQWWLMLYNLAIYRSI